MSDVIIENNTSSVADTGVTTTIVKPKRVSFMDIIAEKQKDQDFNQRLNVALSVGLELYRVLMGALLVFVVPQQCNDNICTASEIMRRSDPISITAFICNMLTLLSFMILYFIEVKRENKMITYLEVNKFTPSDNQSVGKALEKLAPSKKQIIWDYDGYYQKAGYISTGFYGLNAIFSSIVIYINYLDTTTLTVLITNMLFMGLKVADVFSLVKTDKNIFYSAYLKDRVQYNDADPDNIHHKPEVSNQVEEITDDCVDESAISLVVESSESV